MTTGFSDAKTVEYHFTLRKKVALCKYSVYM